MLTFTQGNLLEAQTEALVNTVNTVGIMGKGIALMFKERFPENFHRYESACRRKEVRVGKMFVTEPAELEGPRYIVNFPTKEDWRNPSRLEWIISGLDDLRRFLIEKNVRSVALPPLGAGNGGLEWPFVKSEVQKALADLPIEVIVFEPTAQYQNVSKRAGVEELTVPRALITELVRRYGELGMDCSLVEVQKLAWFLERSIEQRTPGRDPLNLQFVAHKYGPYANRLAHLINRLDGSYLHCHKRISDADPWEVIWFDEGRKDYLSAYIHSEAKDYLPALEKTAALIEGFESPFGLELLASVDWLINREGIAATEDAVREGWSRWPEGGARKSRLFEDRVVGIALQRLASQSSLVQACQ